MSEQTIFRNEHAANFTCISNATLQDGSVSLKARGLHHYLLSLPKTWKANIGQLASACSQDGRTSIASALNELIELGYVTKEKTKDEATGQFSGITYRVFESPQPKGMKPESRKPDDGDGDPKAENLKAENLKHIKETSLKNTDQENTHTDPEVCVCEENENHSQSRAEAPGALKIQQPEQLGGYQGWGAPPPLAVDEASAFIDIYNKGKPATWAIAIPHPGRSNTLRQFTAAVSGSAQAQELLKLALAHLHLNPDFYVHPNRRSGQQLTNRNLDWLLKTPRDGGPPHLLKFAEAAQTAGVNADALIDAAASGMDIQAAKKEFEHKASGLTDQVARRRTEREGRKAENDRIWAAALAEQTRQQQERSRRAAHGFA